MTSTVVTLRNPQLTGNDLTYDVTLLEGSLPETAGPCSLFIDIIGCPLTPMSFAGAARTRRLSRRLLRRRILRARALR